MKLRKKSIKSTRSLIREIRSWRKKADGCHLPSERQKCPICGAPVPPSKARPRKYCSLKCAQKVATRRYLERKKANAPTKLAAKSLYQMQKERVVAKLETEDRLAKRDADYAASPCAAPVTVEERGGMRIETRGQRCIGWRSAGHVSHS